MSTNARTTRVIIVEDKADELGKAITAVKAAFGENVLINTAGTYVGFRRISVPLFIERDGWKEYEDVFVLTDMMFPEKEGGKEEPNGLLVLENCIFHGHFVAVCSDLCNGHNAAWLYPALKALGKMHPLGSIPKETGSKNWSRCIEKLVQFRDHYLRSDAPAPSQG